MIDLFNIQSQTDFYKRKTKELSNIRHETLMEFDEHYKRNHLTMILINAQKRSEENVKTLVDCINKTFLNKEESERFIKIMEKKSFFSVDMLQKAFRFFSKSRFT